MHGDRLPELGDELLEGQLERLHAELERGVLMDVAPVDAALLLLCLESRAPEVAVGVVDLREVEPLAVVEEPSVVEGERVVDA